MIRFIKYKRFELTKINEIQNLQTFFDDLIKDGWEIIYYNENYVSLSISPMGIMIVVVAGKKQHTL